MLKTFAQCPRWAMYKYHRRLVPRREGAPLKVGKWMHRLLEVYYSTYQDPNAWRDEHLRLTRQFREMFDEEQAYYGDVPGMAEDLMEAYLWHYKYDSWRVLQVEFMAECEFPDGGIYRLRADALIEDEFGLWLVDHKWPRALPDHTFRLLDRQSALYLWALRDNHDLPLQGFIFNYGRRKRPSIPKLTTGGRVSTRKLDTEYVALVKTLRRYKEEGHAIPASLVELARRLRAVQYRPGEPQRSTYFYRHVVEKSPDMVRQVANESYHTHKRMHHYPWDRPIMVERVVGRHCTMLCPYPDLCTTELIGGNTVAVLNGYQQLDPMHYYQDDKERVPE